ncbi:MAG: aminoacyl-tRNA hydrolase [Bacteroidota bacterium]
MWNFLKSYFRSSKVAIEADVMKYLVVGLGNIGADYKNTRHNIGFDVVDHLAAAADVEWEVANLGKIAKIKHKGRTLVLLKPSTYMNRSGKAVRYWLQQEKIDKERMIVVVDDLNLDFRAQRLRGKGSPGGHNGLKDIDAMTGGSNYARLRIGIGDRFSKGRQVDFVLGEWTATENEYLPEIIAYAAATVKSFAAIGLGRTMSAYNRKSPQQD